MQVEGARRNSIELLEPAFSMTPEALNTVDVMCSAHKLVVAMIDSIMLRVADINEAVIAAPSVRVDDCSERDATANNGLKRGFLTVRHDLRVDRAIALEDAEDDCFARCAAPSFASDTTRAEVAFVHFDFAAREGRGALGFFTDALSDFKKDRCHAAARKSSQLSRITGRQIKREVAQELTEFTFANFRPPVIAV